MHPYHHSISSARRYGGVAEDYIHIHHWFDESKGFMSDFRHRALRHHSEGIFLCERIFGVTLTNSDGKVVPVRFLGEQHVKEDLGAVPTAQDWLRHLQVQAWMNRVPVKYRDIEEIPIPKGCDIYCDSPVRLTDKECRLLLRAIHRLQDDCATDPETDALLKEEHGEVTADDWENLINKLDPRLSDAHELPVEAVSQRTR